jgi:hypothetical protein
MTVQDALALTIVFAAAALLARRIWRLFFRRSSGCGACAACPAAQDKSTLVPLELVPHRRTAR